MNFFDAQKQAEALTDTELNQALQGFSGLELPFCTSLDAVSQVEKFICNTHPHEYLHTLENQIADWHADQAWLTATASARDRAQACFITWKTKVST